MTNLKNLKDRLHMLQEENNRLKMKLDELIKKQEIDKKKIKRENEQRY